MSATSRELIEMLTGQGLSKRAIGRAIGRDSSLISQVSKGAKPGANLQGSLDELRRRLEAGQRVQPVTEPARRTKASGAVARVRRKTVVSGRTWASGNVKRQAAANGSRSLTRTLRNGGDADSAVTVVFKKSVSVNNSSGGRKPQGKKLSTGGSNEATINLGNAEAVAATVENDYAGNLTAFVLDRMGALGMIGQATPADVLGVELRVWQP